MKLREDWIVAVIGKEEAQQQEENIKQEILSLQTELATSQSNLEYLRYVILTELLLRVTMCLFLNKNRQQYQQIEKEKQQYTSDLASFNQREKRYQEQLTTAQAECEGLKTSMVKQ